MEKLEQRTVYHGYRDMVQQDFRLENGRIITYDLIQEHDPVCILALTTDGHVILAKQFRPAQAKELLELPGGGVEPNEDYLTAAKRELLEETGYIGDFQFVTDSWHSAYATCLRHNFVATNCVKITEPNSGADEITEVVLMTLDQFRDHLRSGELTDMGTGYRCLDFLHLL